MRTITLDLYKFEELDKDVQQKVIETLADINVDYGWWQWVYEDAAQIGLEITTFEIGRYLEGNFEDSAEETARLITENHRQMTPTHKAAVDYLRDIRGRFDEEHEVGFLRKLRRCYLAMLNDEYDYQTSREAIVERIKANDYEFTIIGKIPNF